LAFLGLWFLFASRNAPPLALLGGGTMGTTWSLQYWDDEPLNPALETLLVSELARLDRAVFSTYAPDSELSQLNANPALEAVGVSEDLFAVLQLAQEVYEQSGGAFDPSVAPLVRLWGFGPDPERPGLPSKTAIAAARARVGLEVLQLRPREQSVIRWQSLELDLSAIAKGYAVDVLAGLLQAQGIDDYLLEIGGELRVAGRKPDGSTWRLAIEKPQDGAPAAFALLDAEGEAFALASSGDYRNYREIDGKRYSHEIDPHSGWPIDHALRAVSVVAATAAEADAWATALLVLGPEEGLRLARERGLAAYFIIHTDQGFVTQSSPDFKAKFANIVEAP
jgi:thiamine biosynthesis lipoprotein